MTDDMDIVVLPGYRKKWARRCLVEAWDEAGRPPVNWAGRTFEEQLDLALHGPNAADDPRVSWTRVPHVRGMALDLAVWDAKTVARMHEAGFIRPITRKEGKPWSDGFGGFSQDEPWHFELAKYAGSIKTIGKVSATAASGAKPFVPTPIITKEMIEMATEVIVTVKNNEGKTVADKQRRAALVNTDSGFHADFSWLALSDAQAWAKNAGQAGGPYQLSDSGYDEFIRSLDAIK